jgi:hypothetical protein
MSRKDFQILSDKIVKGVNLAVERLIEQRAKENGELIFSDEHGKIIRVKAKDLLK